MKGTADLTLVEAVVVVAVVAAVVVVVVAGDVAGVCPQLGVTLELHFPRDAQPRADV